VQKRTGLITDPTRHLSMIAISYRRQDSNPVAGRLYDRLQAEFGKGNVFMDFDSIPYGVDFREHIKETLQRAKVVVAIIGSDWSGGREATERRIDDPADFVRLEIASALESGIPIIPVLVNNTPMPEAKNLPAELEGLAFRNGLALDTGIDFHHHADRLIAGIHKVIDPPASSSAAATPLKADNPRRKTFAIATGLASLTGLAGIALWYFLIHLPGQAVSQRETLESKRKAEAGALPAANPEPALNRTRTASDQTAVSLPSSVTSPTASTSTEVASSVASPPSAATSLPATTSTMVISSEAPPPSAATQPPAKIPTTIKSTAISPPRETAPSAALASTAKGNESARESTYFGKVGTSDAIFRLRFEAGDRVAGTYSQGGSTYRLEGRHPKGKLLLDEYTGERITAHLELASADSADTRWEGTMRNTPPDNRVFPVSFGDSPTTAASSVTSPEIARSAPGVTESLGEYTYSGKIGGSDASFRLRFEAGDRVTGAYSQGGSTYRLEGRHPKGKLVLNEYTGDRVTAHIELSAADFANVIRWEGTMRNTPPDNRVFPVSFSRPRK